MKSFRAPSVVLTTAILATASLLIATPASAATTVGAGTFYGASDFGVETTSYPTGVEWFFGDATGVDGPHAFTAQGLELNSDASGNVQILNQNVGPQPVDAADLVDMADSLYIDSVDDTKWAFQLPFYGEGGSGTEFTTLVPMFLGNLSGGVGTTVWRTTGPIGGTYVANDTANFEDFATALFAGEAPQLLAYGAYVVATNTALIHDFEWRDVHSFFMPAPTRTISTTSITAADASTTGFTLTGTNWIPNIDVYIFIQDPDGNQVFPLSSVVYTTDASGNVSIPVVLAAPVALGTYSITFDDDDYFYDNDVFGDPFTTFDVVAAQLAETGASPSAPYFAGAAGLLALMGISAVVISRRRLQQV